MLNEPMVSISITVLKPFVESASAGDKKFPAAQFTKMSSRPNLPARADSPSECSRSALALGCITDASCDRCLAGLV